MKSTPFVLLLLIVTLITGCATGAKFSQPAQIPKDKALVYVYREGRILGAAAAPSIFINGKRIVNLKNGGYYVYYAEPGEVVFSNEVALGMFTVLSTAIDRAADSNKRIILRFDALAGKEYFVEWELGYKMSLKTYDEAGKSIKDCSILKGID